MPVFDTLLTTIEGEAGLDAALETLVTGLAERIKATSNDQNVQRLARELRVATPAIVAAVRAKTEAPA